jgi:hypothetical protein
VLLLALMLGICASVPALGGTPVDPPADPAATVTVSSTTVSQPVPSVPVPPMVVTPQPALHVLQAGALQQTKKEIVAYRRLAWRWEDLMGLHRTRYSVLVLRTHSPAYADWALKRQKRVTSHLHVRAKRWMVRQIHLYQSDTALMWRVMGRPAGISRQLAAAGNVETRFTHARKQYQVTLRVWRNPPHESELMCLHHYEGSWNDRRNPKYNGGLQMDKYFEAAYGAPLVIKYGGYIATDASGHKYAVGGHAYLWTPLEQMHAAENAIRSRGFGPWPQTRLDCHI